MVSLLPGFYGFLQLALISWCTLGTKEETNERKSRQEEAEIFLADLMKFWDLLWSVVQRQATRRASLGFRRSPKEFLTTWPLQPGKSRASVGLGSSGRVSKEHRETPRLRRRLTKRGQHLFSWNCNLTAARSPGFTAEDGTEHPLGRCPRPAGVTSTAPDRSPFRAAAAPEFVSGILAWTADVSWGGCSEHPALQPACSHIKGHQGIVWHLLWHLPGAQGMQGWEWPPESKQPDRKQKA